MASVFLQTVSLAYLLVILTCSALLISHDEECLALFEFKQTILHQNYNAGGHTKFDSWRKITKNTSNINPFPGSDCCLWNGVVCNNKGQVIGLDLSASSLTGVINSSNTLFKLVHLHMLNLSMKNFVQSHIPSEIAQLNQLRSLDLSNFGFYGQIPIEISQLIQLSWLDLSENTLKLPSHGLGYLLQNMIRLEILHLSGVHVSSSVPRFLANFTSLRSIKLQDCLLQNEFPSAIFHLPKLKYLSMRSNSNLIGSLPNFHNDTSLLEHIDLFSTSFNGIIPESISNLKHVTYLALEECYFSGRIPGSLSNLTQLTYLALSENELKGLFPSLATLSKLIFLSLTHNSFEIGSAYGWIKELTNLIVLEIDHMNIHEEILPYLANLTELRFLTARENFIFGRIPSSFTNLTQLTILELAKNQLQGQISSSFFNFKILEFLNLGFNNFSGTVGLDSFLGLNKLEVMSLSFNRLSFTTTNSHTNCSSLPELKSLSLSSCNLREFPAFLQFQMKMSHLLLFSNKIEGMVPNWIWNNSRESLQMIGLSDNFITGFHQHSLFLPWIRLEVFEIAYNQLQGRLPVPPETMAIYDVSHNYLTGDVPPIICELKSLQILYLSSNKLSGTLPPCLGSSNNLLSVLDLKQNSFHGPILMNTCKHGSILKRIDLSENQFTGEVAKSLANCTYLEFLSLADNSFEDVFPLWLGSLPKLQVLLLSSNRLYGAIEGLSTITSEFMKLRIIVESRKADAGKTSADTDVFCSRKSKFFC